MQKYPDAELKVYVVWMRRLPFDSRRAWDEELLDDRRVQHLWDGDNIVGEWLAERSGPALVEPGGVVWDAYYLFGSQAEWGPELDGLIDSGRTIIGEKDRLSTNLEPLLLEAAEGSV